MDVIPTLHKTLDCENPCSDPTSSKAGLNIMNERSTILLKTILLGVVESSTGGEIVFTVPKECNPQLCVYARRGFSKE